MVSVDVKRTQESKSKAPHVKPTCGAPKFILGFIVWATLYDGVGSVKRHLDCARRKGSFFFFP